MHKTSVYSLSALLFSMTVACGSDSKTSPTTSAAETIAATCVPVTDADLATPNFAGVPACSGQMYAKYGAAGFAAVNSAIGKLALAAPVDKLGDSFQTKIVAATPARQQEFGADLLAFLEYAYGSSVAYTGPGMVEKHKPLNITVAQYDYFVTDVVVPALQSVTGVDPNDIGNCFAPVLSDPNFKKTVVFCK